MSAAVYHNSALGWIASLEFRTAARTGVKAQCAAVNSCISQVKPTKCGCSWRRISVFCLHASTNPAAELQRLPLRHAAAEVPQRLRSVLFT